MLTLPHLLVGPRDRTTPVQPEGKLRSRRLARPSAAPAPRRRCPSLVELRAALAGARRAASLRPRRARSLGERGRARPPRRSRSSVSSASSTASRAAPRPRRRVAAPRGRPCQRAIARAPAALTSVSGGGLAGDRRERARPRVVGSWASSTSASTAGDRRARGALAHLLEHRVARRSSRSAATGSPASSFRSGAPMMRADGAPEAKPELLVARRPSRRTSSRASAKSTFHRMEPGERVARPASNVGVPGASASSSVHLRTCLRDRRRAVVQACAYWTTSTCELPLVRSAARAWTERPLERVRPCAPAARDARGTRSGATRPSRARGGRRSRSQLRR